MVFCAYPLIAHLYVHGTWSYGEGIGTHKHKFFGDRRFDRVNSREYPNQGSDPNCNDQNSEDGTQQIRFNWQKRDPDIFEKQSPVPHKILSFKFHPDASGPSSNNQLQSITIDYFKFQMTNDHKWLIIR